MAAANELLIYQAVFDHDTKAFDELVQRHQSRVRGWLRHLAGDTDLADDLAQETFLKAWSKLATYKSTGSFEGWLLRIARNEFLQSIRKSGREAGHLDRLEVQTRIDTDGDDQQLHHGESTDTERFLEILSSDEREVMILVYGIGLSHAEASEVTGLPLGTVKSHVRRSVRKIREQFDLDGLNHD